MEASALQDITNMAYQKPKISYNTIRKNTSLDEFIVPKPAEEDEEEAKDTKD